MILPVRNKYIAKSEVGNQLNIFVFESGGWYNTGSFVLTELNVVVRLIGSADLNRIKNAWANPITINNNMIKNVKTF